MTICSIEKCDRIVVARGLCRKHYLRWNRHGGPLVVLREHTETGAAQEFIEMAINYQDKSECLFWPFFRDDQGYARKSKSVNDPNQSASRYICYRVHGPSPSPIHQAAHNCGKGHLGCVNPHHLRWDTPRGNQADRIIHGTSNKGEQNGRSKLTLEHVQRIRAMKGTLSAREVSAIYDISQENIRRIWRGETWREESERDDHYTEQVASEAGHMA
jgi:hypothetical protein